MEGYMTQADTYNTEVDLALERGEVDLAMAIAIVPRIGQHRCEVRRDEMNSTWIVITWIDGSESVIDVDVE